jgi:ABC-type sugar transport system ATPase subunit
VGASGAAGAAGASGAAGAAAVGGAGTPGERPASSIVSVQGASYAYDVDRPVLKSLSFDVAPGEFVGVVGPNGSGKSTLLDLIDGVLAPGSGAVLVNGRPTRQYRRREIARQVALVPQHFALEFDLSVRDVVEMGAYCRGADCVPASAASAAFPSCRAARSRWSCLPRRSCRTPACCCSTSRRRASTSPTSSPCSSCSNS